MTDDRVLAYIADNPGCTAKEIAHHLGDGSPKSPERKATYASLRDLELRGVVSRERGKSDRWTAIQIADRPIRLSAPHGLLVASLLRIGIERGELGEPAAELLADVQAQIDRLPGCG